MPLVNSTNSVTATNWSTWMTNKGGYEKWLRHRSGCYVLSELWFCWWSCQLCGIRWERKTGKSSNPGVAELRKTANDIGNTNRTNRIVDFKSNARETWCVILVSESWHILLRITAHSTLRSGRHKTIVHWTMCALAERLSQSEIVLPLRKTCYYSPLAEVGVFSTEINLNTHIMLSGF